MSRTIYSRHETPEEDRSMYRPKCEYNDDEEDNTKNVLSDKNYLA